MSFAHQISRGREKKSGGDRRDFFSRTHLKMRVPGNLDNMPPIGRHFGYTRQLISEANNMRSIENQLTTFIFSRENESILDLFKSSVVYEVLHRPWTVDYDNVTMFCRLDSLEHVSTFSAKHKSIMFNNQVFA